MKTILVSLISDQTIPNLQFIKEKKVDGHLFISTHKMKDEGVGERLIEASGLDKDLVEIIEIDAFLYDDVFDALENVVDDENHYIINLTGGTKIMTLAVHDFFKNVTSEIYYLTGKNNKYIKLFPGRKKSEFSLNYNVDLETYLKAYSFVAKNKSKPIRSFAENKKVLDYFLEELTEEESLVMEKLRKFRDKNKTFADLKTIEGFENLIQNLGFKPENPEKFSKYEIKYLTGEWLEEYVYYWIKDNLKIKEDCIGMGWNIEKQVKHKNAQSNELDVLYIKDNKLYIIECKTSVYRDAEKRSTFISDIIYKSDSLRNQLGLYAFTSIFTLDDLKEDKFKSHLKRAEASKVTVRGKDSFNNNQLL